MTIPALLPQSRIAQGASTLRATAAGERSQGVPGGLLRWLDTLGIADDVRFDAGGGPAF